MTDAALTGQTVELLQHLIRNQCVNDGTTASGQEVRTADVLRELPRRERPRSRGVRAGLGAGPREPRRADRGQRSGRAHALPHGPHGRRAREPQDLDAGPVRRGAGERRGVGARRDRHAEHHGVPGRRAPGAGAARLAPARHAWSTWPAPTRRRAAPSAPAYVCDRHWDAIRADYLLTENGGQVSQGADGGLNVTVHVGEKGVAWRRLRVRGTPGHGSMPYGVDNALVKAAKVVARLADYRPSPYVDELWRRFVDSLSLDPALKAALVDPVQVDDAIARLSPSLARMAWSSTHTTFSPNQCRGGVKTNVIPDVVDVEVDIRTVPGDSDDEVRRHLDKALADLSDEVEVEPLFSKPASVSPTGTPLWDVLGRVVDRHYPGARLLPRLIVGFTDAPYFRARGAVSYGFGLFSRALTAEAMAPRFHGNDERVDVESLALTTQAWLEVCDLLLE